MRPGRRTGLAASHMATTDWGLLGEEEPDRREMQPTVLQVGGMGVPMSRKADRAQREEVALHV